MTYADQIRFIASAILPGHPEYVAILEQIAIGVQQLEAFADETVAEALERARLRHAAVSAGVVPLEHFRRLPRDGAA